MACVACVVITYYIALLRCDREDSILRLDGSIRMGFGPPLTFFLRTGLGVFNPVFGAYISYQLTHFLVGFFVPKSLCFFVGKWLREFVIL